MHQALKKLQSLNVADAYLLSSRPNIQYITGFTGDDSEVLIADQSVTMFTDSRYSEQALEETKEIVHSIVLTRSAERIPKIAHAVKNAGVQTLGIEEEHMNVAVWNALRDQLPGVEFADVSRPLLELRAVKTPEEISLIRTAAKATDEVMRSLADYIVPGMRECDLLAKCLYEIAVRDMQPSFDPIIAAGAHSALPHAGVTNYAVKKGDLLTMDIGCRYRGYCADMTRTLGIGHVDAQLKTIYDIVEQAQISAETAAVVGTSARAVDAAARDVITDAGYGEFFGHGTGHGVGLQIHELPLINSSSDAIISEGMVFTIEPGIYIAGLGGARIEDTYAAGIGSLFQFPKMLIEV